MGQLAVSKEATSGEELVRPRVALNDRGGISTWSAQQPIASSRSSAKSVPKRDKEVLFATLVYFRNSSHNIIITTSIN